MLFLTPLLDEIEAAVIKQIDELRQTLKYAVREHRRWTRLLRRNLLARAIQGSNSIEGYNVMLDDAIAAAEGDEPMDEARTETWAAVMGYRDALTYILQLADDPHFSFSVGLIRSLHYMMMKYDLSKSPGLWRPGTIFVRNDVTGNVVYEGPSAEKVPGHMEDLMDGLNYPDTTPMMVRGAMAHLNMVMIHPFRDGNGRMARALQTLVLAREGVLTPTFSSIEEYLGRNTQAYYNVLAEVGAGSWQPERDARPWVRFCLKAHFQQATTVLRRVRESEKLWELLEREASNAHLHERTVSALFDAAMGFRVRNVTYRSAADISDWLASRDLRDLTEKGFLVPSGQRRGRVYRASGQLKLLREQAREARPEMEDPFTTAASRAAGSG